MSIEVEFRHRFADFVLEVGFRTDATGITALFGHSGAGKTTIVNAIAGLFRPASGRIVVGSRVFFDSEKDIWIPPLHRRVGYVFQDSRLFPHLSVERNLQFGWRRSAAPVSVEEFFHVVELLGLQPLLNRKPRTLSGGEQSRVALGRALLASPNILLMDEPLAAIDTERRREILPHLELLRDHSALPIVYVSHSLNEIARLADHLVIVKGGRVAASGALFDLITDLRLPEATGEPPYGAVLETTVARDLKEEKLTVLAFAGGELRVPLLLYPEGTRLRTHIRASDVIIACEEPRGISANNVLPVTILEIRERTDFHVDVRLLCGTTRLVAWITHASRERLELAPGVQVFAIVKSVSIVPQARPTG
ncbi:MAG: molybdenum ABC transporter ATP-binding protein [Rhizomicrobium sp.]